MTYTQGKAYVSRVPCDEYKKTSVCDHQASCRLGSQNADMAGVVALPHSCDEWEIGGREEVEALIADLTALLPLAQ